MVILNDFGNGNIYAVIVCDIIFSKSRAERTLRAEFQISILGTRYIKKKLLNNNITRTINDIKNQP